MTTPKRAKLKHIKWDANQKSAKDGDASKTVDVQFNPQSLKVTFSNKNSGGDQPGGSSKQFVGSGTTKLAVELLFDTTADGTDVRVYTEKVAFYIKADTDSGSGSASNRVPPGVQFEWGSFIFRGTVDSMDETLEYFSEEGVPLRANISLSISRQEIEFLPGEQGEGGGGGVPLETAQFRDSIQGLAGRNGKSGDWKGIAAANNIDDPLRLSAGALINVNAGVGISGGAGLSVGGGIGVSASVGVSVSGGAGVSVSGGAGVSGSALAKASAGAG
ncbi:MAG: hypothetical protein ABW250_17565, partial [Pyrinomonadaceae bacterium]